MSQAHENGRADQNRAEASKYMTFKLASEEYGLEIGKVRELIGMMEITRIPRARNHIRGVINLRGKVIPVVDLRTRFGLPPTEPTGQTVIIVVQLQSADGALTIGVLVDEVLEVRTIVASQVEKPPALHGHIDVGFLLGIGKSDKRVIFLLDIDRVLSAGPESHAELRVTDEGVAS
jgi:purine-binding chemotaxis protein CheW